MGQILTDELGQSFQLAERDALTLGGRECLQTNIGTVEAIAEFVATSLGPTGCDKILVSPDGDVTVTNDGATILRESAMSKNPISQLVTQLSEAQDAEIGDGTTSIVVLAAAILRQARGLIAKGVHPVRIAEGFSAAQRLAVRHLNSIAEPVGDLRAAMLRAARTTLSSKIVSTADHGLRGSDADLAEACVDAVLAVADPERLDVDLDRVNVMGRAGGSLAETRLIKGIVLSKQFSHPQMKKVLRDARVALLSCPFEPPKLKTKNSLIIKNVEEYKALESYEKEKFKEMVRCVKAAGADAVMCQWGFDDEANALLLMNELPAVRWVGGHELGLMASHISGRIVSRFEDLRPEDLGTASLREEALTTESEKIMVVENSGQRNSVTILVRGSTEYVIEEAKRSIRDALCSVRNIFVSRSIVYGGGSAEVSASSFVLSASREQPAEYEEAFRAFSSALLEVPMTLAANSGLEPMSCVEKIRELQASSNDPTIGVDCLETGEKSMKKAEVFEALASKVKQFQMATDLACMILKINDVISTE